MLEGSDKLARDAFVHSVKVFTSLVLSYASIISHNSGAPTEMSTTVVLPLTSQWEHHKLQQSRQAGRGSKRGQMSVAA